ncbi:MAG TPA: HAD family phosphatase [Gammaproteobacteria bacterium]|nr:HAD family phosphatase [Gammaproteobacteria bacterium]
MTIKNLIFDLGGVILNIESALTRQAFTRLGVPDLDILFPHNHGIELFSAYETGKISSESFRKHLKALMHIDDLSDSDFDTAWNAMLLDLPPENLAYIKQLSQHYRTFLFSNTNEIHLTEVLNIAQRCCGVESFADYFEREYYSFRMGMSKPDPASYLEILRQNQLLAEETLFIDDNADNIAGASSVGIQVLHLKNPMKLTEVELIACDDSATTNVQFSEPEVAC